MVTLFILDSSLSLLNSSPSGFGRPLRAMHLNFQYNEEKQEIILPVYFIDDYTGSHKSRCKSGN